MKKITINGRFLTMPLSGVQRTAYELTLAIDRLLDGNIIDKTRVSVTIIYSGEIINHIPLKHIRLVNKGMLKGNLWEQLELPFYSWGSLLLSLCSISTLFKRRQVVMIHDASTFVNKQFFSGAFRTWYNFALPVLAKIARHIITVSEFSKKELAGYLGVKPEKITVIYNSADHIERFGKPPAEFISKIDAYKPYCLAVSNLAENKNFGRLSRAIADIDFKNYTMLIAGGSVSALKTVPPNNQARYLGYVTNNELKYLYSNASLFIFPSIYEGFGIPPLEAMTLGCPVIASDTSSIPEVLDDACRYFNPLEISDMADKISLLLNNEGELQRLKEPGFKQARKYNWEKSALQLVDLLLTDYA